MVRIAIAGGSSNVALEVIDALVATKRHEILLLSRKVSTSLVEVLSNLTAKQPPIEQHRYGVTWAQTEYLNVPELARLLKGVHTVLSFITTQSDHDSQAQRSLIDAAVHVGVKRFAPSEWATSTFAHLPVYAGKQTIRDYLQVINKDQKVLEYCLFIPGLFTNYFAHPYDSAEHFRSFETHIDFDKCRALVLDDGENDLITLTTVQDLAQIVVKAVEYEGEWPVVGGIKGTELSIRDLIAIGESIRGRTFSIETLRHDDLEVGRTNASWLPMVNHPGLPDAHLRASKLTAGMILSMSAGALNTTDEWNKIFPEYQTTSARDFLAEVWRDKP